MPLPPGSCGTLRATFGSLPRGLPAAWFAFCLLPFAFCLTPFALRLLPFALRLLPYAFCLTPFALRLLPYAFCLFPYAFCLTPFQSASKLPREGFEDGEDFAEESVPGAELVKSGFLELGLRSFLLDGLPE